MADRDSFRAPGSRSESVAKKRAGTLTFGAVRESMLEKQRQAELDGVRREAVRHVRQPQMPSPEQAMDAVRAAPPHQFEYAPEHQDQDNPPGVHTGFMAQDMERTPAGAQVIQEGADGMKRVDPERLAMVNTAALHSLEQRLARLEGKR